MTALLSKTPQYSEDTYLAGYYGDVYDEVGAQRRYQPGRFSLLSLVVSRLLLPGQTSLPTGLLERSGIFACSELWRAAWLLALLQFSTAPSIIRMPAGPGMTPGTAGRAMGLVPTCSGRTFTGLHETEVTRIRTSAEAETAARESVSSNEYNQYGDAFYDPRDRGGAAPTAAGRMTSAPYSMTRSGDMTVRHLQ